MRKARTINNEDRVLLPKLRKIDYSSKKEKYHLRDPVRKRRAAIDAGVKAEMKKTRKSQRQAAIAKKGRFNVLRIYRRTRKVSECQKITRDMRYMNSKYGLGKTKNICGKRATQKARSKRKQEKTRNSKNSKKSKKSRSKKSKK